MSKAQRNDPCPCGSGKKYKACCYSKQAIKKFSAKPLEQTATKLNFSLIKKGEESASGTADLKNRVTIGRTEKE